MVKVTKDHPFLEFDNLLTVTEIKKGRTDKICVFCGKVIEKGVPHKVHLFTDYEPYPTHLECSLLFSASLS